MNVLNEIWKIASGAWAQIAKTLYCLLLKGRLKQVNVELDFMTKYVENAKNGGATMFANYFAQKIPALTVEREDLETELEISGCGGTK